MNVFEGQWLIRSSESGGEFTLWNYTGNGPHPQRCVTLQLTVPDNTYPLTIQREENDNEWKDVVTVEPGRTTLQSFWAQGVKVKSESSGFKGKYKLQIN